MVYKIAMSLILAISIYANEITITKTGVYQLPNSSGKYAFEKDTEIARKQALILAKSAAIEEAGTTIYSSFQSTNSSDGASYSKDQVSSYAAAVINSTVIKEGWKGDTYEVTIEAKIATKNIDEVLEKHDARVKNLVKVQQNNERLVKQLDALSKKMLQLSGSMTSFEPSEYYEKQEDLIVQQMEILSDYDKNTFTLRRKFKGGALKRVLATRESKIEPIKRYFNGGFKRDLKRNFDAKIKNVIVEKSGKKAKVTFNCHYKIKNFKKLITPFLPYIKPSDQKSIFPGDNGKKGSFYRVYVTNDPLSSEFNQWMLEQKYLVLKFSVGSSTSYSIPVAGTRKVSKKVGSYILVPTNVNITKYTVENIPQSDIDTAEGVDVELVEMDAMKWWNLYKKQKAEKGTIAILY